MPRMTARVDNEQRLAREEHGGGSGGGGGRVGTSSVTASADDMCEDIQREIDERWWGAHHFPSPVA